MPACTLPCMHAGVFVCACVFMCAHTCTYIYTCTQTQYIHARTCTHPHTYLQTHTYTVHPHTRIYTGTCGYTDTHSCGADRPSALHGEPWSAQSKHCRMQHSFPDHCSLYENKLLTEFGLSFVICRQLPSECCWKDS